MKTTHFIFGSLVLVALGSCQVHENDPLIEPEDKTWSLIVEAKKGMAGTKALSLEGSVICATWTEGDVVVVRKGDTAIGQLTAQSSGANTILQGALSGSLNKNDELTLSYLSPDYRSQDGSLEYIASHCDYATATVTVTAVIDNNITTTVASFQNKQSITAIDFSDGGQQVIPSSITIESTSGSLLQYYDEGTPVFGTLTINNADGHSPIYVALCSNSEEKDSYQFSATSGDDYYVGTKKAVLENGKYYQTHVILSKADGPEAVDLGLSVKWASYNLGASSPDESGNTYLWGVVDPYTSGSAYPWTTSNRYATKYNVNSVLGYQGFTDDKTILDQEDDAAFYSLRGKWRIPTIEEWEELKEQCTITDRYNFNGQTGKLITSKINGNSIFIPTPATMPTSTTMSQLIGNYWSASLCLLTGTFIEGPSAYATQFSNSSNNSYSNPTLKTTRWTAFRIRPVWGDIIRIEPNRCTLPIGSGKQLATSYFPESSPDQSVVWSSDNPSVATVSADGVVTAISVGTTRIVATSVANGTTKGYCSVSVSSAHAVDLGLSVMWASMNLGATAPEQHGNVYAWGQCQKQENVGSQSNTKYQDKGSWRAYKWATTGESTLTKYCTVASSGLNGFVDNKVSLDPEDDVARQQWGNVWRIPTAEEIAELVKYCTRTTETYNGETVDRYTSVFNGNSIIIPATESASGSYLQMWSSSIVASTPENAYTLYHGSRSTCPRAALLECRPISEEETTVVRLQGIALNQSSLSLYASQSAELTVAYTPDNAVLKTCKWTSDNNSVAKVTNGLVSAISSGTATITAQSTDGDFTATCVVTVSGPEAVDLGLSVKWGTTNIGASDPFDVGELYAWGEISTKSSFTSSNYRYINNGKYTKYCSFSGHGYNGFVDNKTKIDYSDDVARHKLGGLWRMPTTAEIQELIDNSTVESVSEGYIIKSKKNNNYIILPYGSYWWGSELNSGDDYAVCLSVNTYNATLHIGSFARYAGRSVRPVIVN